MNAIFVRGLRVACHLGVPDDERASPQTVEIDIRLTPRMSFEAVGDSLAGTADYDAAARRVRGLAAERPRKLIETLAAEIAGMLLTEFPVTEAEVEIRKFILPDTDCVAVRCIRRRE